MPNSEHIEFTERLKQAMAKTGDDIRPTALTVRFNAHYPGKPVTVHAVRKWTLGESMPTQEKLRVLANMFKVPPDWLRFGTGIADNGGKPVVFDREMTSLIKDVQLLDDQSRVMVRELVRMFLQLQKKRKCTKE